MLQNFPQSKLFLGNVLDVRVPFFKSLMIDEAQPLLSSFWKRQSKSDIFSVTDLSTYTNIIWSIPLWRLTFIVSVEKNTI